MGKTIQLSPKQQIKSLQETLKLLKSKNAKTEFNLQEMEEKWRVLIQNIPDIVLSVARDGTILAISRSALGVPLEKIVGDKVCNGIAVQHRDMVKKALDQVFRTGKSATYEAIGIGPDSSNAAWYKTRVIPIKSNGTITNVALISTDITATKQTRDKLQVVNRELSRSNKRLRMSIMRDTQTGLYNHWYLEEAIETEFCGAKKYQYPLSLIFMDIDYFRSINDVYSHQFGDLVLKQLARLLKKMVRKYDSVVRYGGEEFVIMSPGVKREMALTLAHRIQGAVSLYNFGKKNRTVKLTLTIAVVCYPEDRVIRGIDLIENADRILEKAKICGGGCVFSSIDAKQKKRVSAESANNVNFLKDRIEKLTRASNQSLMEAVLAFAKTIKLKDHYTGEHVESIVHYAVEIAKKLRLPKDEISRIKQASILHDLGKIGISDKILLKNCKLTKKEFEEIKKHPQIGADIIRPIQFLHSIIPLILYHHEKWDGKGYPKGLTGEEIPVGARIVAIADVYHALISDRPYRKAFSKTEAVRIIKQGFGTQFDPRIVNVFIKIVTEERKKTKIS